MWRHLKHLNSLFSTRNHDNIKFYLNKQKFTLWVITILKSKYKIIFPYSRFSNWKFLRSDFLRLFLSFYMIIINRVFGRINKCTYVSFASDRIINCTFNLFNLPSLNVHAKLIYSFFQILWYSMAFFIFLIIIIVFS